MAVDDILLQECHRPWLRFYNWEKETISIGYFTPRNSITLNGKPWVRRRTGGGLVHHGSGRDATYALGIPRREPASKLRSSCVYRDIHQALQRALSVTGIACDLDDGNATSIPGNPCFENPVSWDVISCFDGNKIAGGAQRRCRHGLLHQGSIQGVHVPEGFGLTFANALAGRVQHLQIDDAKVERAVKLADTKYSSPEWRHRK